MVRHVAVLRIAMGRDPRTAHLLLFGISAGLLIGTKSIGLVYAPVPGLLFLMQLRGRGGARAVADMASAALCALCAGGFWYLRNWLATGSPVFPLHVAGCSATHCLRARTQAAR